MEDVVRVFVALALLPVTLFEGTWGLFVGLPLILGLTLGVMVAALRHINGEAAFGAALVAGKSPLRVALLVTLIASLVVYVGYLISAVVVTLLLALFLRVPS